MAVEKVGIENYSSMKRNVSTNPASLGTSAMGKTLVETVLSLKFRSLSGNFQQVKGQLEASAFEIFNVIGSIERIIGYWDQQKGLSRQLKFDSSEAANTDVKRKLKHAIWPGDTTDRPATKKLRIGVPVKEGFYEFLKVEKNNNISGFSALVFFAAVNKLPFPLPHDFLPFNGTYDNLLWQIKAGRYDAVVGDTTIVANRSSYVDFTLPYSESGVSMVVLTEDNQRDNIWIFLKPLSLDLWLTTGAAFIFTGCVIWVLEHRVNTEFRGPPEQQLGMIFWFSFSTLVFAHREKVVNNWSRLVLIIWVFVVLILTQSYTASLASMLTVQRLQPVFTDIREIKRNGYNIGYQKNSFIKGFLMDNLRFEESKLKPYVTIEEYNHALSRGTNNGGVAAIFDEIPYLKLFIAKNCSKYTMVGPTYKTDGFGFAFPRGSPLVSYMSRAILNVTQHKDTMDSIERNYFTNQTSCDDQSAKISSDGRSLHVSSFGGLFIIAGVVSMFSLLMYLYRFLCSQWPTLRTTIHSENSFRSKMVELAKHFDKKDLTSHPFTRRTSRIHAVDTPDETAIGGVHDANDMQNNSAVENNIDVNENESNDGNILSGHTDSSIHVPNLSS
ncbi:glutamate receptor 2.7-like [Prunus avium]|uniref:Glutamate receptor 2.7-like n=1 Tax=Prunus avium TaxID=42229 RepID=A0A6P5R5P4_PRUAV|nr:glutamate receptor 2.7-like [Prunus avium]